MKKILNKICLLFILIFIIFLFSSNNVLAQALDNSSNENSMYNSYDYVIDKYDVNIVVNENNTFDITETITAYFNVPKHGIYRTIPLKNIITRLDGTTSTNQAKITNINVDNEYTTSRENGNYKIKIGSPNYTLTGEQTYVIRYTYNIGKDPVKDYDELYYNIIGTEWDTIINNITFTVNMPKDFDESKLGFSSGIKGSINNSNVIYSVDGNTISGNYNGILGVGMGLTIRLELPEGYFTYTINPMDYIIYIIPIIFLGISIFLWYKYGRDEQVIETVEFYPPEGFNSLELGFLYKGNATNKDVTSLLIYLANKGYLKIEEYEEKEFIGKHRGFKLIKLKEYDGNNKNEKIFLEKLFFHREQVSDWMLQDSFYTTIDSILKNINSKENKNKIFEKSSLNKRIIIISMILIVYLLISIIPAYNSDQIGNIIPTLLFSSAGLFIVWKMILGESYDIDINGHPANSSLLTKIFVFMFGILFAGIPWCISILPILLENLQYLLFYILGILCILLMTICLKYLPKSSSYGNKMLGKIRGFKKFLETAEKDKLEAMVMDNPNYFYDILPYTYVLGVSDKWIKKFETISLKAPDWYGSYNTFDANSFGTFMNRTMSSAQSVMSSKPDSDSSSGSSGGGSSGGGSGGGGGGSW